MAQWPLGDKGEARRGYDRVVDWMNENDPASNGRNEEAKLFKSLTRLRSEAAELLGVTEKR
jgi:hypothetical protein